MGYPQYAACSVMEMSKTIENSAWFSVAGGFYSFLLFVLPIFPLICAMLVYFFPGQFGLNKMKFHKALQEGFLIIFWKPYQTISRCNLDIVSKIFSSFIVMWNYFFHISRILNTCLPSGRILGLKPAFSVDDLSESDGTQVWEKLGMENEAPNYTWIMVIVGNIVILYGLIKTVLIAVDHVKQWKKEKSHDKNSLQ